MLKTGVEFDLHAKYNKILREFGPENINNLDLFTLGKIDVSHWSRIQSSSLRGFDVNIASGFGGNLFFWFLNKKFSTP